MAKAQFHKSQRVFVKPVGTWAVIESVMPHWVKDVDEPLRISYDCGLGRLFHAHELVSEQTVHSQYKPDEDEDEMMLEHWRIDRRAIRWRPNEYGNPGAAAGTYPVVVTDEIGTGGWRVAGTEFDRDPARIEHQARMIAHTPDLLRLARRLSEYANENPKALPSELAPLAQASAAILRAVYRLEDEASVAAE